VVADYEAGRGEGGLVLLGREYAHLVELPELLHRRTDHVVDVEHREAVAPLAHIQPHDFELR
jgi:hypothetical protein